MADSDGSSEEEKILKKCPVCTDGVIEFECNELEAWGDCNNNSTHGDKGVGFEVTKLQPFTAKYTRAPLHTYTMPAQIPWSITEKGLKFTLRDWQDGFSWDEIRDALLLTLEGLSDWVTDVVETVEWDGVDWDEYEVEDDGITEYILEDPN